MVLFPLRRWALRRLALSAVILVAACAKKEAAEVAPGRARPALETRGAALVPPPASAPAPAAAGKAAPVPPSRVLPPKLKVAPLDELAFVPADVEAVVRVDLAQVGSRSEKPDESLKTLDFLLRAQQPAAWEVLHGAGIAVGKELAALYLVVGAHGASGDATLVVGVGRFDAARLGAGLRRTDPLVEPAPAPLGQTAALFRWKHPSAGAVGANESPVDARVGDAAVGVGDGIVLFGPPALVRRALAVRAGLEGDVRTSALAAEILAVDPTATVWGVALPGPAPADRPWLPTVLPGMKRARFQAALASPGPDIDGLFTLRAEFASHDQAVAFGDKLKQILSTVALLGDRSPLGAGFAKLKDGAVLKLDDNVVIASAAL